MNTLQVDLLTYQDEIQIKHEDGVPNIYCQVRKKWIVHQPEELVRQLVIGYLTKGQQIRLKSIKVESSDTKIQLQRTDLAVYNQGKPFLLIECKTWDDNINQKVLNQISRYNAQLKFPFCWVTNGRENFLFSYDKSDDRYEQLSHFPEGYI